MVVLTRLASAIATKSEARTEAHAIGFWNQST